MPTPTPTATPTPSPTPVSEAILTGNIGATDATIPVSDVSVFPDSGVIQVDNEQINFAGKTVFGSGAAAVFGTLNNATRGVGGTVATAHALGVRVRLSSLHCTGDCDSSGSVTVDELVQGVNIALGTLSLDVCPSFDSDHSETVTVDELITAVGKALNSC